MGVAVGLLEGASVGTTLGGAVSIMDGKDVGVSVVGLRVEGDDDG